MADKDYYQEFVKVAKESLGKTYASFMRIPNVINKLAVYIRLNNDFRHWSEYDDYRDYINHLISEFFNKQLLGVAKLSLSMGGQVAFTFSDNTLSSFLKQAKKLEYVKEWQTAPINVFAYYLQLVKLQKEDANQLLDDLLSAYFSADLIFSSIRRIHLNEVTKAKKNKNVRLSETEKLIEENTFDRAPDKEETVRKKIVCMLIDDKKIVSPKEGATLKLSLEGKKTTEIAQILGIPEKKVYDLRSSGKSKLQKYVEKHQDRINELTDWLYSKENSSDPQ